MFHNVLRTITLLWLKAFSSTNLLFFFFLKASFATVMEYSLPEANIGAKWECVWNDKYVNAFYSILIAYLHQ
ncbi:MAG: hypothetical protein ACI93N_001061 [Flavobacteriaceae bacterium]|jgi:hypothetical protein